MYPQSKYSKPVTRLLMACATTAFILGYCSVQSIHADSTPTTTTAQPTTTLTTDSTVDHPASQVTNNQISLGNHTDGAKAQQSANQNTAIEVTPQFAGTSNNRFGYQPVTQPSYATQPTLDPNVDMDKVNFRVSMHIPLSDTLTYDVIYIPQSSSDIYFGNDQAEPIPDPVNVGTYKVWLSQTGYNNIVAGHNFWVSTNGGKYVYYPTWDIMQNISIGPYDPTRFGYGTYTIKPYDIAATITGEQTMGGPQGPATELIDPNQYQISFTGANPDSDPFEEVSHNFRYTLQAGDLVLVPTQDNNSYQVGLSAQGLANIKQALTASFNNDANNFTLLTSNITTKATAQVLNQPRTITRTIIVKYPNGQTEQYQQAAILNRNFQLNGTQTGIIWGDWNTAQWPAFPAPKVQNYEPSVSVVPEQTVDQNTTNQTITISYEKITHDQTDQQGNHNEHGDHTNPNQGQTNVTIHGSESRPESIQNQATKRQQQLPQTGNDHFLAILGLSGLTLLSLLGLTTTGKQRH